MQLVRDLSQNVLLGPGSSIEGTRLGDGCQECVPNASGSAPLPPAYTCDHGEQVCGQDCPLARRNSFLNRHFA
jgi:hypothetical protein